MLCNTALRSGGSTSGSPFINSDILYFVIVFLFGASNGSVIVVLLRWTMYHSLLVGSPKTVFFCVNRWISSLSMIIASSPSLNPAIEHDEKEIAGSLAGFCLTGGLVVGSLASFVVGWFMKA
jgi:equilibrative nucleoside transporter 1/2/3